MLDQRNDSQVQLTWVLEVSFVPLGSLWPYSIVHDKLSPLPAAQAGPHWLSNGVVLQIPDEKVVFWADDRGTFHSDGTTEASESGIG